MELRLYDTLTREKRPFTPIDPANVRMYVCGPTVYDYAHIGNARPVIVFDVLFRLLRHIYGESHVKYVRNITDVDDKINARAAERGIDIRELTEETYQNFKADVAALGCLPPTVEPRATEHIEEMKTIIERLIKSGHAYVAEDNVLFNVPSMTDYGQLSKRPMDEMIAGARVEVAPYKKDAQDFVLWKPSKPGEPGWPSPGGIKEPGRPGWHIECSAMSWKHLGETFDIHGGGIDLVFPHHENEIAQSRCAFHQNVMANYWMHNGFLQVEGEKMSKSLGNFLTIRGLLDKWPGDVLRLQMLMTHYRQPIDWTENNTRAACNELEDWAHLLQSRYTFNNNEEPTEVLNALSDDLNTSNAISALRELFAKAKVGGFKDEMKFAANCHLLGFRHLDKPGYFQSGVQALNVDQSILGLGATVQLLRAATANNAPQIGQIISTIESRGLKVESSKNGTLTIVSGDRQLLNEKIERLVADRTAARAAKNFAESDRIRDELAAMGVVLKDSKDGTTWEIAR
ncbi:cysteine--tRNA ligase [Pseudolabrys sp. FHR47]|uniref:cysteine--tRNA ligase n=1 Tax=Pseudolabrys sp. FHR47 TaxID=2562284 RepID=UPI0010BE76A1|nr:cysteine--tRNA ligase [Pseudolabrys sp. FHR47]